MMLWFWISQVHSEGRKGSFNYCRQEISLIILPLYLLYLKNASDNETKQTFPNVWNGLSAIIMCPNLLFKVTGLTQN